MAGEDGSKAEDRGTVGEDGSKAEGDSGTAREDGGSPPRPGVVGIALAAGYLRGRFAATDCERGTSSPRVRRATTTSTGVTR